MKYHVEKHRGTSVVYQIFFDVSRGVVVKSKLEVFAARLRALRKEKNMTQRQMGDLMGITERNYQRWEGGEVNASGTALIFLGDYFGVSTDYLLGRTDNREINR